MSSRKVSNAMGLNDIFGCELSPFPGDDVAELVEVLKTPIERGGRFGLTGNGHNQLLAREQVRSNEGFGSDWISAFGLDYVREVVNTKFAYFQCPRCNTPI